MIKLPQQLCGFNNSNIHLPNNTILLPVDSARNLVLSLIRISQLHDKYICCF